MRYFHIPDVHLAIRRITIAFEDNTVTLFAIKHAEWFFDNYQRFVSETFESKETQKLQKHLRKDSPLSW